MLEHEQKNWNLSPKIRFLEILKLLPDLRELNYEHSQKLNVMQLHCTSIGAMQSPPRRLSPLQSVPFTASPPPTHLNLPEPMHVESNNLSEEQIINQESHRKLVEKSDRFQNRYGSYSGYPESNESDPYDSPRDYSPQPYLGVY